ncbi:hypothetical protein J6S39_00290 [Candidatus Saccharibacteria bacterium]|nr:hypothetical protein [Candidatus Saccharibacteria bacterium]
MKNSDSKAFFKDYCKAWCVVSGIFLALFIAIMICGWTMVANAATAPVTSSPANATPAATAQKLPPYTTKANLVKTSGNYLHSTVNYDIDGKTVLTIDLFYRLQKNGTYKAVYYNAQSADGSISFSERDIADADNVIYVDDNNLGLAKGQVAYAEIQSLLDEVGYN